MPSNEARSPEPEQFRFVSVPETTGITLEQFRRRYVEQNEFLMLSEVANLL
jgi:hypothetical protein